MRREVPPAWRELLESKGKRPSLHGFAEDARFSTETARRLIRGAPVRRETIREAARVLRVDEDVIYELRGELAPATPWEPPASADLLTEDERDALARLINAVTKGRDGDGTHAASIARGARQGGESVTADEAEQDRAGEGAPEPPPHGGTDASSDEQGIYYGPPEGQRRKRRTGRHDQGDT